MVSRGYIIAYSVRMFAGMVLGTQFSFSGLEAFAF